MNQPGFSLIELSVVVLVIGLLASVSIPMFNGQKQKAWDTKTKSNLVNSYSTVKSLWLDDEKYSDDLVAVADQNEKGLQIRPRGQEAYIKDFVQVDFLDRDTVVLTQRSQSGKDFCVVGHEKGMEPGRILGWEDDAIMNGECAMGSATAAAVEHEPEEITSPSPVPSVPAQQVPTNSGEPQPENPTMPEATNYGDYAAIKANYQGDATCPFDEPEAGKDVVEAVVDCSRGVKGKYNGGFLLAQQGATFTVQNGQRIIDPENKSVYFLGTPHSSQATGSSFNIANNGGGGKKWTSEIWVRPAATASTRKGVISLKNMISIVMTPDGFEGVVGTGDKKLLLYKTSPTKPAKAGQWYHLALTWDNGLLKFYQNGTLISQKNIPASLHTENPGVLQLGYDTWTGAGYLQGNLDNYSFYNKTLSSEQIKNLYQAGCQCAAN